MKKYITTLTEDERDSLGILASKNNHKSQKILNALILLLGAIRKSTRRTGRNARPTKKWPGD